VARPLPKPSHLRLVVSNVDDKPRVFSSEDTHPYQRVLFPKNTSSLLVHVDINLLNEHGFHTFLDVIQPHWVIDIRKAPRFDIGNLHRKYVLSHFSKNNIQYRDLSILIPQSELPLDEAAQRLADAIELLFPSKEQISGPIVLLRESGSEMEDLILRTATTLPSPRDDGWDLYFYSIDSERSRSDLGRETVFISHANPADNDFTLWLALQLKRAGYKVWTDITDLKAGEIFWDTIENQIRNEAAKVIVVLSKNIEGRHGLLDEINLAVTVERSKKLMNFVTPVRLDHTSFSEVRANLARKHIVSFSTSWADGLNSLLLSLQRDGVPRSSSSGPSHISTWWKAARSSKIRVEESNETLVSNWLPVLHIPQSIYLYDSPAKGAEQGQELTTPFFRGKETIGTFAAPVDLETLRAGVPPLKLRAILNTEEFFGGKTEGLFQFSRRDAQRSFAQLVNAHWASFAQSRGLLPYGLASGRLCWYFPFGLVEGDQVKSTDPLSSWRRKSLYGRSETRNVAWHFALEARFAFTPIKRLFFTEHVIFSSDGIRPLDNKNKMHRMRRGFCKAWWNDRWRDLFLASLQWMSKGEESILLNFGMAEALSVSSKPLLLSSPVSIQESLDHEDDLNESESVLLDFVDENDEGYEEDTTTQDFD
jgi:hypothetical protein